MASHASSRSIPVSGAQPRSAAIPTVSIQTASGIPAPQPLRVSTGHIAVVARPTAKKADPEADLEEMMFPPDQEERDDEDIPKEELVTLGTTPSPAPTPSDFPFSPPLADHQPDDPELALPARKHARQFSSRSTWQQAQPDQPARSFPPPPSPLDELPGEGP